jgi:hypothetical protein
MTEQNVHVFDCRQNVQYLTIDKMFMYLTEQNVHVFD